jgi:hypothetical protein
MRAPKTPRSDLVHLNVTGDLCPNLLPRVLGLVAQFDLIPCGIALTRSRAQLRLALELDRPDHRRAEILLHKVEAIPTVRRAGLTDLHNRQR